MSRCDLNTPVQIVLLARSAKEVNLFVVLKAPDNWELADVKPLATNSRQRILKQHPIHLRMSHMQMYALLIDTAAGVVSCLPGQHTTDTL